jgi:hypothetical protein
MTVSLRASSGEYVVAVNGGGGSVVASGTTTTYGRTLTIVDLNGGELMDGDQIALRAVNGQYLQATGGGGSTLLGTGGGLGVWETFTILGLDYPGEVIYSTERIAIRTSYGYFLVAENGGGEVVNADRTSIGPWETFQMFRDGGGGSPPPGGGLGGASVSLRTDNNHYVVALGGGGGYAQATSTSTGAWETFTLEDLTGGQVTDGDSVAFRTSAGWYLQAENGGGGSMVAWGQNPYAHETFVIINISHPGQPIAANHQVALVSANGFFACAEQGGGDVVNVDRTSQGSWERFWVVVH